ADGGERAAGPDEPRGRRGGETVEGARFLGRRPLQLDGVAVGVEDVERGSLSFRAVAPAGIAEAHPLLLQVASDGLLVVGIDADREMIHVPGPRRSTAL